MIDKALVIDVKNLNKRFGDIHAVKNLALKVKKGEIFGFLGPNGSGKTTTIRMLCGLLTPDSGEGLCLGYNILTQSREIKKQTGYMSQRYGFYEDLTVKENLDFVARVYNLRDRKQKVKRIIHEFQFEKYQDHLTGDLSGGWKQRVALAASLLHEPRLLLLDEPTAGIDPKARREFWDQILDLSLQGITTLVSTHYMDEAERCTRLAYIINGELRSEGTLADIIHHSALTTYRVTGPNLAELAKQLKPQSAVEQVVLYGDTLHVSSKNAEELKNVITSFILKAEYQYEIISPNMEDVFISLVGNTKDQALG